MTGLGLHSSILSTAAEMCWSVHWSLEVNLSNRAEAREVEISRTSERMRLVVVVVMLRHVRRPGAGERLRAVDRQSCSAGQQEGGGRLHSREITTIFGGGLITDLSPRWWEVMPCWHGRPQASGTTCCLHLFSCLTWPEGQLGDLQRDLKAVIINVSWFISWCPTQ